MATRRHPSDQLTPRALNRALLARQHLLERTRMSPLTAIAHLVGLQTQVPDSGYIGLWTRLDGFRIEELARLMRARRVVRIALMRSTIHLVTARECARLRPVVQPAVERGLWSGSYGRRLAGLDRRALASEARAILDERPRTFHELGILMRRRWPARDGHALAMAARGLLPLVQVPPRGVWGETGPAAHTTFEAYTGRALAQRPSPARTMLRYLAAFGPASIADMQAWSGLSGLRPVIEPLASTLRTFRDVHGRELFDLPDAPRPDPETPAPPRLLPEFDNVLLAHADRTRVIADAHRGALFAGAGLLLGPLLLDGFVAGRWRLFRERRTATVVIEPFGRLQRQDRVAVEEEAGRAADFFAPDADAREVRIRTRQRP